MRASMVIFERLLCSCRLQSSLLIDFSLEEKVAGSAIRLSFQRAPHEASPHQTKRARPRRASLGIFNTAGYEVLIALFLTSQIPFLSLSLLAVLCPFILSLFPLFKLPAPPSQFSFLLFVAPQLCTVSPSLF